MTPLAVLPRDELFRALGGNKRLVSAFEQQAQVVSEVQEGVTLGAEATGALQDARVLTLAPNDTFTNERVLKIGPGIAARDDGTYLILAVSDEVAHVAGGFRATLTAQADVTLVLPFAGVLATQDQAETLREKTLAAAKLSDIPEYADDSSAQVGEVYTITGSTALHYRRS